MRFVFHMDVEYEAEDSDAAEEFGIWLGEFVFARPEVIAVTADPPEEGELEEPPAE